MRVDALRTLLATLPDDLEVLISGGPDHSYHIADVVRGGVAVVGLYENKKGEQTFLEWYGEKNANPNEKPIEALVLHFKYSRRR